MEVGASVEEAGASVAEDGASVAEVGASEEDEADATEEQMLLVICETTIQTVRMLFLYILTGKWNVLKASAGVHALRTHGVTLAVIASLFDPHWQA